MAFLNVNTPLKNLKTGDYFYPLTNLDQIITGTSRLSAFMSEDSSNHNLLNLTNIGNLSVNGTSYFNGNATFNGNISFTNSGTGFRGINYGTMGDNDQWRIGGAATGSNAGYMEIATADDGNEPIYIRQYTGVFNNLVRTLTLLDASGNTSLPGALYFNRRGENYFTNGPNDAANGYNGALNNLVISAWYGVSFTTSCAGYTCTQKNAFSINTRNGYAYCGRMYNAVWNDYAEFRQSKEQKPGICVQENDNGILTISDKRLIPGAGIISDTYGYIEGETEKAKTPIAVSGRVLAYTYQDRNNYHAGMAVCSAPDGTIDIMTREEIQKYPDAIIGIVSEIPNYEKWGIDNSVNVNNRIWIKVRY